MISSINETDKKQLKAILNDAVGILENIDAMRQSLNELCENVAEKYEIEKKTIMACVRAKYKDSFEKAKEHNEEFEFLYSSVLEE